MVRETILVEEIELTEMELRQRRRRESFGERTAQRVQASENCLFSLLSYRELSRRAEQWYEACAEGIQRGNYAPMDEWIRSQSYLALTEGFRPLDIMQLLLICRHSVVEEAEWGEEVLSALDEVINEVLIGIRAEFAWTVPEKVARNGHTTDEADAVEPLSPSQLALKRRTPRSRAAATSKRKRARTNQPKNKTRTKRRTRRKA